MVASATSLLVLLALGWAHAASEALHSVQEKSAEFHSTSGSGASSRGLGSRAGYECPAVCSACPACPAHPGCPACPSAPPCPRSIPPGYKYYQGLGYYRMHYGVKKWHDAEMVCEAEGGYLVVINSRDEANLVSSLMTKHELCCLVHIGIYNFDKKGKYLTVLGDDLPTAGYDVWVKGQPTGVKKEFCGAFQIHAGIHDIYCSDEYAFLCELDT